MKRKYDLEKQRMLRPKDAAQDARLCGMPLDEVRRAIRRGEIYPILRRNARVVFLFDCALVDWRARQVKSAHLFTHRIAKCA